MLSLGLLHRSEGMKFNKVDSIQKSVPLKILAVILVVALVLSFFLHKVYSSGVEKAKMAYIEKTQAELNEQKELLEKKLGYIYQSIRTMSLTPGVRKIDRYAENFDPDAKMTIQQLYNNAFLNINLSEIYILPKSLDPDKLDLKTGKNEEPIVTFDELIVNDRKSNQIQVTETSDQDELEEVEIDEYRLMKRQLELLASKFPTNTSFKEFEVPMVSGSPVITCDNSEFTKAELESGNNDKRLGLIFTVPSYDVDGKFHGAVSAILRTEKLKNLLKNNYFAIYSSEYQTIFSNNVDSDVLNSFNNLKMANVDNTKIFSKSIDLEFSELTKWHLFLSKPDAIFWNSNEVKNLKFQFYSALAGLMLISVALMIFKIKDHQRMLSKQKTVDLLIAQSTKLKKWSSEIENNVQNISSSSQDQTAAVEETSAAVMQLASMTKQNSESAKITAEISQASNESAMKGGKQLHELIDSIIEIQTFSVKISEIVTVIDDIAFQTNLLALNAAVEAARAGEQGKGFAVVADAVRSLAQKSGEAAKEISSLIKESVTKINRGSEVAQASEEIIKELLKAIGELRLVSEKVAVASKEQDLGIESVSKSIISITDSSVNNAKQAESLLRSVADLNLEASSLEDVAKKIAS